MEKQVDAQIKRSLTNVVDGQRNVNAMSTAIARETAKIEHHTVRLGLLSQVKELVNKISAHDKEGK